jgi:hypothetical protein
LRIRRSSGENKAALHLRCTLMGKCNALFSSEFNWLSYVRCTLGFMQRKVQCTLRLRCIPFEKNLMQRRRSGAKRGLRFGRFREPDMPRRPWSLLFKASLKHPIG